MDDPLLNLQYELRMQLLADLLNLIELQKNEIEKLYSPSRQRIVDVVRADASRLTKVQAHIAKCALLTW